MFGTVHVDSVRVALEALSASHCRTVYDYWNDLRGDRFAPTWQEFDLWRLHPAVIPFTHVADVRQAPFDIVYRFWGTGMTEVLGYDRTGKSLTSAPMGYLDEDRRRHALADYQEVVATRAPKPFLWDAASARRDRLRLIVPGQRLPLSDDGARVTQVVTTIDFSDTREIWEDLFEVHKREPKLGT